MLQWGAPPEDVESIIVSSRGPREDFVQRHTSPAASGLAVSWNGRWTVYQVEFVNADGIRSAPARVTVK